MKKNFIIKWQIYPFDVMVSMGEEQPTIVKKLEKTGYKLSEAEKEKLWMYGDARTIMLSGGQTIIRLDVEDYPILTHETFHAVNFLMDRIGVKLTEDSGETFAYAQQYLIKEILKNWHKKKK